MAETLQLIDGILYKENGLPVSVVSEDRRLRIAYRKAQQQYAATGGSGWLPDGTYRLSEGRMEAVDA